MSLRPCKECGQQISSDAKVCPHCGKKQGSRPRHEVGCLAIIGVVALFAIIGSLKDHHGQDTPSPAEQAAAAANDAQFAHAAAGAKILHDSARNPDSFKLVQVLTMSDRTACYTYRAQNGFGGMNVGYAVLSPTNEFKTDEMQGFHVLWNKLCAHKSGTDRTQAVAYAIAHTE
jgi:zinc-ribbon domain